MSEIPAAERQQESAAVWLVPSPAAAYNWPDTGRVPGATAR